MDDYHTLDFTDFFKYTICIFFYKFYANYEINPSLCFWFDFFENSFENTEIES